MEFALKWIQENIGKFGGDATQVTITGESAGAGGVGLLAIAKDGELGTSLFRNVSSKGTNCYTILIRSQVIAASPYFPPQYKYNAPQPTKFYDKFVSQSGCGNSIDTLACLRSKDTTTLQHVNQVMNANNFYGNWPFLPVTDTGLLRTAPSVALTNKRVNGEHILVGNNADEGSLFVAPTINTTTDLETWLQSAYPTFTSSDIAAVLAAYPSSADSMDASTPKFVTPGTGSSATAVNVSSVATGQQQRANNIYAEATFVCPSYWLNDAFTTHDRTSYHYQYSVPVATHGSDLTAYFGPATLNQPPAFTSVFRHVWGNMTVAADPEKAVGFWPAWIEGETSQLLNLNTTGGVLYTTTTLAGAKVTQYREPGVRNDIKVENAWTWESGRGERCEFWRGIAGRVPT
jgi:carboxylesterase type B